MDSYQHVLTLLLVWSHASHSCWLRIVSYHHRLNLQGDLLLRRKNLFGPSYMIRCSLGSNTEFSSSIERIHSGSRVQMTLFTLCNYLTYPHTPRMLVGFNTECLIILDSYKHSIKLLMQSSDKDDLLLKFLNFFLKPKPTVNCI